MPCRDVIPIAANEDRAASVTVGSLARGIVNVAGIDVVQPWIRLLIRRASRSVSGGVGGRSVSFQSG